MSLATGVGCRASRPKEIGAESSFARIVAQPYPCARLLPHPIGAIPVYIPAFGL
jgi:hypothetical protein